MTEVAQRDRENAVAWELRTAWATGRPVSLLLLPVLRDAPAARLMGVVHHISATDAFVQIEPDHEEAEAVHVPLSIVQEVYRPHFHEPGMERWRDHRPPRRQTEAEMQIEGQRSLVEDFAPPVSSHAARSMKRAVEMMLPPDLLAVLHSLDAVTLGAPRGRKRSAARTYHVADHAGRSERWTARRLKLLARYRLAERTREGRAHVWSVAR